MEKIFDDNGKLIKASNYVSPIDGFNTETETMEIAYSDGFKEGINYIIRTMNSLIDNCGVSNAAVEHVKEHVTTNDAMTQVMYSMGFTDGFYHLHDNVIKHLKEEGYEISN
jgi:hypothetical protein